MAFSENTLSFLFENRLHDSRSWFAEHKKEYQKTVLEPLRELVEALTPVMLKMDDQFCVEPKVDRTISRIWRDTRYTKDPSLYRDSMWITFKRGSKMNGGPYPGVYFGLGQYGFDYGCGFYHASTEFMAVMREMVLAGDGDFRKADRAYRGQDIFVIDGDRFKRPRYGDRPDDQRRWLELRNISFNAESKDFPLLFSNGLAEKLTADFEKLIPIYRFLLKAAEEALRRETENSLYQR